ncbi:MAG: hypothetical protein QOG07_74, partial [Pseudonocardiales bacterium]|nr:hypothetical protein [Pseudonocardiales bacterium]
PPWSVFLAIHPDATRMKADEIAAAASAAATAARVVS